MAISFTFAGVLLACGATAKMEPTNVGDDIWVATVKDPGEISLALSKTLISGCNRELANELRTHKKL